MRQILSPTLTWPTAQVCIHTACSPCRSNYFTDKVLSTTTGHQVAEDTMSRRRYFKERTAALHVQQKPSQPSAPATGIFRNTRIYINGYLEGTTDIEIKRLVIEGGGKIL